MHLLVGISNLEKGENEEDLIKEGIWQGEEILKDRWTERVSEILEVTELKMPDFTTIQPVYGGRRGNHTEYLQPLLEEMTEVVRLDPTAEW